MTLKAADAASRARSSRIDVCVVGAGFAGAVMAERAGSRGLRVLVIERREHIAGNAYDRRDEHGVLVHTLRAAHLPHQRRRVSSTTSRASPSGGPTSIASLAAVDGQLVPMPINRTTINRLYGLTLSTRTPRRSATSIASPSRARRRATRATRSSRRSAATSTSGSSAATRASSGGSTRPSWTHRSARGSRRAPTTTTATSPTASSRCRATATRRCSSGCSTTR